MGVLEVFNAAQIVYGVTITQLRIYMYALIYAI